MRVLIVEDEPDLLRSLAQALREEGYAVDTANDGEDGLFKAEGYDYDAIVLDVMLPGLDGWEILKRLRKTKKTPVLMLTARDQTRDRVKGLDTGADDYVVKPFDLDELLARIGALIRRSQGRASATIECGGMTFDLANKSVVKDGKTIIPSAREFAILEILLNNIGRITSRSQIESHIYDWSNEEVESNTVEVHISSIRRKLGKDFIKTIRGLGYIIPK
jgi:two-component system OmpR family response regulator